MAQTIKLKRSSVQNNVPSTSDLDLGELAINTYDGKLFIKKNDGSATIVQVGGIVGSSELTDGSVTTTKIANNAVTTAKLADNSVGITQLNVSDGSSGQVLTTNGSGTLSFSTVSSGASNQNAFSNIAVSGQSTLAADATTDTLNLVAGSGITITTAAGTDSVTINSTATGSVTEAFKTIAVSGQNNVVADSATDTLTFVGGSNMTITTNDSNDTITFASSGSGTGNTGGIDSQIFNGDGTEDDFTLTTAPTSEDHLWIFVDGVYQNKDSYTISGTTLTMADAPDNGTKLAVHHVRVGTPANGTITGAMLASPLSLTGDFAVDTNVLKVDSTNNRVGINITSPSHPLDVVGNANILGDLDVSGNLGVGTTSPIAKLDVVRGGATGLSSINARTTLLLQNNNSAGTVLSINAPNTGYSGIFLGDPQQEAQGQIKQVHTTNAMEFTSSSGASEMALKAGKLGIGNISPTVSLDVGSKTDAIKVPVGTTAQRPGSAVGSFRYNSTDSLFEGYTAAGWGAIAGSGGSGSSSTFLVQELTGNGSTTAFTLEKTVTSEDNLIVFNEGVFQRQDSYAAANTTITFDTAPANGNKLVVYQMETGVVGVAPKIDTMTGDGSDTTLTLSVAPASENQTIVNIDGVTQHKATYSVSGTTLTFSSPPPNGSAVECITLTNMSVTTIGDNDLDTKVHFDETADDDVIRFDTAGAQRMVIGGTGKVGIGSGNPDKTLVVQGADAEIVISDTNSTPLLRLRENGTSVATIRTAAGNLLFDTKPSGGSLTERLKIETSGNATFNNDLTVTGNFTVNGTTTTLNSTSLTIDDKKITVAEGAGSSAGANESGIEIGVGAVGASSNPSILYYNAGTKFVVNKPLDVTGTVTTSGDFINTKAGGDLQFNGGSTGYIKSTTSLVLDFDSDNNQTGMDFKVTHNGGTELFKIQNSGAATFAGTISSGAITSSGTISSGTITSSGNIDVNSDGGQLQFGADNDMQIYHNGANGEINCSSTDFTIDAGGDISLDADGGSINFKDGGAHFGTLFKSSSNMILYSAISNGDIKFQGVDGGSNVTALQLDMSNAGAATFNSSINLDNASHLLLERGGEIRSEDTGGSQRTLMRINGSNDLEYGYSGSGAVKFMGGGSYTERMRIHTNSNIGIGTTTPLSKLHVKGAASNTMTAANAFAGFDGVGGDGIIIGARASSPYEAYIQSGYLPNIGTSHHYPLIINPHGGNVGIHTTAPSHPLHVAGDALITTTGETELTITGGGANYHNGAIVFKATNSTSVRGLGIYMHDAGGDHEWYAGTPYGASDQYQIGRKATASHSVDTNAPANAFVTVKNDGDVGIGTNNPTSKLHVEGTFKVRASSSSIFNDTNNAENVRMLVSGSHFNADQIDKDFQVSSDTLPHALSVDGASGKVAIGDAPTASAAGSLQVYDNADKNRGITHQSSKGSHYYNVANMHTAVSANRYWHIKTNFTSSNSIMFVARVHGYSYGNGGSIVDISRSGYAYGGGEQMTGSIVKNNGSSTDTLDFYYASDSKIVFRHTTPSSGYYNGYSFDIKFQSPTGWNYNFEVVDHVMNSTSGEHF